MADSPLPSAWLFETLDSLRREMTEQHQRLRTDVTAGFEQNRDELRGVRDNMTKLALDVNTIKVQRDADEKQSVKRGAWAGILAGFLFSVLMKLADYLWNPK